MRLALAAIVAATISLSAWFSTHRRVALPPVLSLMQTAGGPQIQATMAGHEFRQDDLPSLAASPDGSLWLAWLSFVGDRDDIGIRHFANGKWSNLQWVPNTGGDSWLPQIAVDAHNRPWVVWSSQVNGNWDLYARSFDPAKQEWSALTRLTNHPLPDINPRLTADGKGHLALVWQGFRNKNSNIFLKTFDGEKWSADIRITNRAANDWEPAVAMDTQGNTWVAYDTYKAGNYDVYLTKVSNHTPAAETPIATTPHMEARPTLTIDSSGRLWIAWEQGGVNWGKDNGYWFRTRNLGIPLGGQRRLQVRAMAGGEWREPTAPIAEAFQGNSYHPEIFSDGHGSVWVSAIRSVTAAGREAAPATSHFEYWVSHLEGNAWSKAWPLPHAKGRSSTRINSALVNGGLWVGWPTDNRAMGYAHRPLRQQVYAGMLPASTTAEPSLKNPEPGDTTAPKLGHANEPADVRAIRAYTATVAGKPLHILRGDFHRHTELSWDGGGTQDGNLQDFYRYMIDVGAMDFGASTDHQGGEWPYWWWYTQKMTDMYHVPGAYVPIFGYERSAIYPNGHRNVFFAKRSESRVTPFNLRAGVEQFELPLKPIGDEPGVGSGDLVENDTKLLYDDIRSRNGIAISHTSSNRMGTDWRDNNPALEPVVEIYQGARANSEQLGAPLAADPEKTKDLNQRAGYQPAGFVNNAWAKGYKLGIITSSDHGSTHISYAMVYTDNPTRQGVLDAIRKRHTYGAMDNIILEVHMGEHFMGDEFPLAAPEPLKIKVRGTRPVARVDIIKDSKVIYSTTPNKVAVEFEYTDKASVNGKHYYYVRVQQDDQTLAWSSPMFINYK
jgi:hypothetical protein